MPRYLAPSPGWGPEPSLWRINVLCLAYSGMPHDSWKGARLLSDRRMSSLTSLWRTALVYYSAEPGGLQLRSYFGLVYPFLVLVARQLLHDFYMTLAFVHDARTELCGRISRPSVIE